MIARRCQSTDARRTVPLLRPLAAALSCLLATGCTSPLASDESEATYDNLRRSIQAAMERELDGLPASSPMAEPPDEPTEVEQTLAERRAELDAIGPYGPEDGDRYELGSPLDGVEQPTAELALADAIRSAVEHNLSIRIARLQPAINVEDVIQAEAVFDWVVFADAETEVIDEPTTVPVLNGIPLGSNFTKQDRRRFSTGLRRPLTTGGEFSVSTDVTRSDNENENIALQPDPGYASAVRVGYDQPLARGFGRPVNTASIRIAENAEARSVEGLRRELLNLVDETERAYWDLVLAWNNVAIQQWLVDQGQSVKDVFKARERLDTTLSQKADATAVVEQRKADVIRARRTLREASDRLKVLLNDPEVTVSSELLIRPVDALRPEAIAFDLRESVLTAVQRRPEIRSSALDIDDARLRQLVADNARLPALDLRARMTLLGLDDDLGASYDDLADADFVDLLIGLSFEYPIRNRAAEAGFRQARLQRSASVLAYQRSVLEVIADVKSALRDVVTNYELISATRSFRVAQAENLRALRVEQTLSGLTPEVLNLRFQRQNNLALARQQELTAQASYLQSISALHRALGIGLDTHGIALEVAQSP